MSPLSRLRIIVAAGEALLATGLMNVGPKVFLAFGMLRPGMWLQYSIQVNIQPSPRSYITTYHMLLPHAVTTCCYLITIY